jgi:hypothetical protein
LLLHGPFEYRIASSGVCILVIPFGSRCAECGGIYWQDGYTSSPAGAFFVVLDLCGCVVALWSKALLD